MNPSPEALVGMGHPWLLAAIVLLLQCDFAPVESAVPRALGEFLMNAWETDDGLPENSATAMVQTFDGHLWFGTFNGLVRFDGVTFTVLDPANTPELPSKGIVNLHLDRAGSLWVATFRGVVCRRPDRWDAYNITPGQTPDLIRTFAETRDGALYATTFTGKVIRFAGDRFVELPAPPGAATGYIGVADGDGRLNVVQDKFVGFWDGKAWIESLPIARLDDVGSGVGAGSARDGGVWIVAGKQLFKIKAGREVFAQTLDQEIISPWSLSEDSRGRVWVSSNSHGVYQISSQGQVRRFHTGNGLTYDATRFVFEDREYNLWIGSSGGGIMRLKGRRFTMFGLDEGLPERVVNSVAGTKDGGKLIATYGEGTVRLDGLKVTPIAWDQPKKSKFYTHCILEDRVGRIWMGSFGEGLFVKDAAGVRRIPFDETTGDTISALFEDSRGQIWIGGRETVVRFTGGRFEKLHSTIQGLDHFVGCFGEDPSSGAIFAGSSAGLSRLEGTRFVEVKDMAGRSMPGLMAIKVERDGTLWLGTGNDGLLRLRQGRLAAVTEAQGLPARTIGSILDDDEGNFWLGSNRGVIRAARRDIESVMDGKLPELRCSQLTLTDGLASLECAQSHQPNAMRDSSGKLWFATLKGVAMIDPREFRLNTNRPPVIIEQLVVDGRPLPASAASDSPLKLPAGSRRVEVHYTGLSFSAPEKTRFRYHVEGEKGGWINAGSRRVFYMENLRPRNFVLRVQAANNDGVWNEQGATLAFSVLPFYWETLWFRLGAVVALVGGSGGLMWRSASRRARIQRERFESQKRYQGLVNSIDGIVWEADGETFQMTFVSPHAERLLGYPVGRWVAEASFWAEHIHPEDREAALSYCLACTREQRDHDFEYRMLAADGRSVWLRDLVTVDADDKGRVRLRGIMLDITNRKQTEEALRQSEELTRLILQSALDAVVTMSSEGLITGWNAQAEATFGWKHSEAMGRRMSEVLVPERLRQAHEAGLRRFFGTGETSLLNRRVEMTALHRDGREIPVDLAITPIRTAQGVSFSAFIRDLSGAKEAQMARASLEAQLRQAQKMEAIGQLSGGVAHDFNNILTVIQMHVSLLQSRGAPPAEFLESADEIGRAAQRAANLTQQLLAFSRRQTLQLRDLHLNEVVVHMTKMLERILGEDIHIQFTYAPQPLIVHADQGMLDQILLNLAVNARDAMPRGGRLVIETSSLEFDEHSAAQSTQARPGSFACLSVSDTGCGIPKEILPRIFDPFFTTKDVGKGTGLGLATIYGIVQQHQGWISVHSDVGRGTTFRVYLPRLRATAGVKAHQPITASSDGAEETILFVEDEPSIRMLGRRVLTRLGYRILEAANGPDALKLWQKHKGEIRLLLTDLVMPEGMTGIELAQRLLRDNPALKVIYASGYSAEIAGKDFPMHEGVNFLSKPYDPSKLAQAVRAILDE